VNKKQSHVPEMREPAPNRAERRHPEKTDLVEEARVREEQEVLLKRGTDGDISVRARSSGHKKKTADKWNQ
jgi:hypothetical protein